ncbi:uracil-DNA glycosylase [Aeromicrobium sp. CF4.19]|uniref:uracil-DNA glycosylase n=1 Tax=Aeromicrobium sp. CF4.19 TaxID=3373082 RepID=UPI003EE49860
MAVRNPLAERSGTLLNETACPGSLVDRRRLLQEPHVVALEAWAARLRATTNESVPSFDPLSGGTMARLLVLREEPRCLATQGSGFASIDNDDAAAHHTTMAMNRAAIPRTDTLHWNVVPWWIRNPQGDQVCGPRTVVSQARRARPHLAELLTLLPHVQAVLLLGREASRAWAAAGSADLPVLTGPHPSPLAWNTRDRTTGRRNSDLTLEAFAHAADLLTVPQKASAG